MKTVDINTIYTEDCMKTMDRMPDEFIDLVVTSPPYDTLRTYDDETFKGWNEDVWKDVIRELARVLKRGGVIVWITNDQMINGSKTGSSFKQAIFAMECGLNLNDTMIWAKSGGGAVGSSYAYSQLTEFMFIFSKGRPKSFSPIKDVRNKSFYKGGTGPKGTGKRGEGGLSNRFESRTRPPKKPFSKRANWWILQNTHNGETGKHPAPMPEQLAYDHIISWSQTGDLVYDPFMGAGTVAKCCILSKRRFVGSEISGQYAEVARARLARYGCDPSSEILHRPLDQGDQYSLEFPG